MDRNSFYEAQPLIKKIENLTKNRDQLVAAVKATGEKSLNVGIHYASTTGRTTMVYGESMDTMKLMQGMIEMINSDIACLGLAIEKI